MDSYSPGDPGTPMFDALYPGDFQVPAPERTLVQEAVHSPAQAPNRERWPVRSPTRPIAAGVQAVRRALTPVYPTPMAEQLPRERQHAHGAETDLGTDREARGARRGLIVSPNFSARGNKPVRLVIVHTAEGARTVESLGAYFANPSNEVSSHAGIDDNRIETYVPYDKASWTVRSANAVSDNVELCGFARWSREQWLNDHPKMLELTARWIAERCKARGIPLRKLSPAEVADGESGVIGHVDWTVGARDGSHSDPGEGFPWNEVMEMANHFAGAGAPLAVQPVQRVEVMPWTLPAGNGMQKTIPIPCFRPDAQAVLWMVTGWQPAHFQGMYFIRDQGPGKTPQQESWGGTGAWTLAPDDRPSFPLPPGCTSVAALYDAPRDIQCLIVYPAV